MKKSDIWDVGIAIVVVAGIMVAVRPGSKGPGLVKAFGNAFSGGINAATGDVYGSGTPAFAAG